MKEVSFQETFFSAHDQLRLYTRTWGEARKGIILFLHGLGDHQGTARYLIHTLVQRGYLVTGYDARGHGQSPGKRGHVMDFDEYCQDLLLFIQDVQKRYPDVQTSALMGYDLGALVGLRTLQQHGNLGLQTFVGLSPLLHPSITRRSLKSNLYRLGGKVAPTWRIDLPYDASALSHDLDIIDDLKRDPLCFREVTTRALRAIQEAAAQALLQAHQLRLPTLFLQAGEDRVTDANTLQRFAERTLPHILRVAVYPGYYHALHNETPDRRGPVFEDLMNWLDESLFLP